MNCLLVVQVRNHEIDHISNEQRSQVGFVNNAFPFHRYGWKLRSEFVSVTPLQNDSPG